MISQLYLTVVDSVSKAPLPDVVISLRDIVHGGIIATQRTDAAGKTIFTAEEAVWNYTAFKGGFQGKLGSVYLTYPAAGYKIELITTPAAGQPPVLPQPDPPQLPPKPGEIIPLPGGEIHQKYIGTRCELVSKAMFNQQFFAYREMYSNKHSSWESRAQNAVDAAMSDSTCFLPAPPTPADWQTGIEQQVKTGFDGLGKYLSDGLKSAADSMTLGLLDLEARLKAWVQANFLGKIEAVTAGLAGLAAKVETEAANRLKGLLDLEARLKAWVASNILEMLLLKLMEK